MRRIKSFPYSELGQGDDGDAIAAKGRLRERVGPEE